jgi:hypothetical protein
MVLDAVDQLDLRSTILDVKVVALNAFPDEPLTQSRHSYRGFHRTKLISAVRTMTTAV